MVCLIDAGVAAVGDQRLGVVQLAIGPPHLTRGADRGRHRGIDDDVARHVQVGDAAIGVDHGEWRPALIAGLDVGFDCRALIVGQAGQLVVGVADAVVRVYAQLLEQSCVLLERIER